MTDHFVGVFDVVSGHLIVPLRTTDVAQLQIQAPPGSGRVVLEGDFRQGGWRLGVDGWPEQFVPEPAAITAGMVKDHAARLLGYTDWMVVRAVEGGPAVPLEISQQRAAIRAASNRLEAMSPIPADFQDPKYWSEP